MSDRKPRRERMSLPEQGATLGGAAVFANLIWSGLQAVWPDVGETFDSGDVKLAAGLSLAFLWSVVRDFLPGALAKPAVVSLVALLSLSGCSSAITGQGVFFALGSDSYAEACRDRDADGSCSGEGTEVRGSPVSDVAGDLFGPVFQAVGDLGRAALSLTCNFAPILCAAPPPSEPELE